MKTPSFLNEFVSVDKETASSAPVFKGTRVAVQTLFDHLNESSLEDFLAGFPSVSRKQAESVIDWAAKSILSEVAA